MSRLASDPVFAALTRPQMIGGVTYTYAILNLIVTGELFLITKSFWVLWITRVRSCPRVRNFSFWGGNSYTP